MRGPRCQRCGEFLDPLARGLVVCRGCRARRRDPLAFARAAAPYEGLVRQLVVRAKFQGRRRAVVALAEIVVLWLAADAASAGLLAAEPFAGLVPVPLHWRRRLRRGYNQAGLLAAALAPELGGPVSPLLRRVRATRPQVGLGLAQREANVAGAFAVDAGQVVPGGAYLLIDDVYTTGATLRECARMLRAAGAGQVAALTAARPLAPGLAGMP